MKYSFLFFLTMFILQSVFLPNMAYSQYYRYTGPSYVAINGGYSHPMSVFGRKKSDFKFGTYANPGMNFGIEGAYFYTENVGFGGLINFHYHTIDVDSLKANYLLNFPEYDQAIVDVKPFMTLAPMIGFFADLPTSEYFSFTFKLLSGFYIARKPEGNVLLAGTGAIKNNDELFAVSANFAIYTSAGIRYSPFYHWSFHLNAEFVSSNFNFEFENDGEDVIQKQLVRSILFTAAIAYRFNPR